MLYAVPLAKVFIMLIDFFFGNIRRKISWFQPCIGASDPTIESVEGCDVVCVVFCVVFCIEARVLIVCFRVRGLFSCSRPALPNVSGGKNRNLGETYLTLWVIHRNSLGWVTQEQHLNVNEETLQNELKKEDDGNSEETA